VTKDILEAALDGRAWKQDAEAFAESTGTVVAVLTAGSRCVGIRCPVCLASGQRDDSVPCLSCFGPDAFSRRGDAAASVCRGGMPCVIVPVRDQPTAWVMVSGYVGSDGERRELLGRLLATGLLEKQARAIARATPILRSQAAAALARLGASHLEALLAAFGPHDDRALEYELLYEIGRGFDARLGEYEQLPEVMLDRAMKLTSADAGAVYLLDEGGVLHAVASRGDERLLSGSRFPLGEGTIGEAGAGRRALLVTGFADTGRTARTSALAVPLLVDDALLGVVSLVADTADSPLAGADLELMELFAESAARALANARRYSEANSRVLELMQLNELSKALLADAELDRVTYLVTSVLDKVLEFEIGGILLFGREEPARIVVRSGVTRGTVVRVLSEAAGMPLPPRFLERCAIVQNEGAMVEGPEDDTRWTVLAENISTSRPEAGYLFVATRDPDAFAAEDVRLLRAQAGHASVALEKARTYARLRGDLEKLVSTLSAMADAAERTETGHSGRVMAYAIAVGEEMGLPLDELEALRFAGLLHDIGKLGVSEEIILKPARLTAEEMAEVRRHAEIGAGIVDQMEFLESVAPIVLHHHERWDGGGYPKGLKGEEIPLPARILAVADAFDAMTCERSYSKALPMATARIELVRGAGAQFDPDVVEAFLAVLDRGASAASAGLMASDDGRPHLPA
jgi:putative nucleotidyltransferase with HDIG domain